MCGIVGSIGNIKSNEIVLRGLKKLEYRGYDSCGIAYFKNGIEIKKSMDKVEGLISKVSDESSISIGHTRWATHGKVSIENAHPHKSHDENIVMVHNGVIENYKELKEIYLKDISLKSQTDTEVIVEVLNYFYKEEKDIKKAIKRFIKEVKGSYASIFLLKDDEKGLYVVKNKSPMLIGKRDNGFTISSDPLAVNDLVDMFYQIGDKMCARIDKEENVMEVFDKNLKKQEVNFEKINLTNDEISKGLYDTFMLKEIEEQPNVIRNLVKNYKEYKFDNNLIVELKNSKRIYIVASGTSYNSGLIVKDMIQKNLNIATECVIGSEFGYSYNVIEEGSFFIFLSQSGETADSMLVFNQIKSKYPILAVTNVKGSQMDREADYSLLIHAGVEVAVASTKAYIAQIATMFILINKIVENKEVFNDLLNLANYQEIVISNKEKYEEISEVLKEYKQAFYVGRLMDYSLAQEAALKVKEISYINVLAISSGELKHGTISLIDENQIVICLINDKKISLNTRSNIEEIKARGGRVIVFSNSLTAQKDDDIVIEYNGNEDLLPLISIIPHQYLSYYTATKLKLNVDKPRNLAKSVTVE